VQPPIDVLRSAFPPPPSVLPPHALSLQSSLLTHSACVFACVFCESCSGLQALQEQVQRCAAWHCARDCPARLGKLPVQPHGSWAATRGDWATRALLKQALRSWAPFEPPHTPMPPPEPQH
jgi:hypothetical protein